MRESEADRLVAQMPVDRLREATRERLRVGALTEAGITTVGDVLGRATSLSRVPGVGEVTARGMLGAAETLRTLAREDARVTLDPARRDLAATRLLGALHTWEVLGRRPRRPTSSPSPRCSCPSPTASPRPRPTWPS